MLATGVEWIDNSSTISVGAVYGAGVTWIESDGVYSGNEAPATGAARFYASDVILDNVLFDGNTATTGGSAALHVGYTSTLDATDVTVTNHQSGTNASGGENYGGAVWLYSETTATLTNVDISHNTSDNIAGGLYAYDADIDCVGCTFDSNTAVGSGGALYMRTESVVTLDSTSVFSSNHSDGSGGAIYNGIRTLIVNGTEFTGNTASFDGGAIYQYSSADLFIQDATFDGSESSRYGGALYLDGDVTIDDSTFVDNTAVTQGGAVFLSSTGTIEAANTTFDGNQATASGADSGAAHLQGDATFDTCTFTDNSAADDGGALYVQNGASVDLVDTVFDGNSASSSGGAILSDASFVTISGGSYTDNSAYWGGAFYDYSSTGLITADDVVISGNQAGGGGGAVMLYNSGRASLSNCTVSSNDVTDTGGDGGGVYIGSGGTLLLDTCTLDANMADDQGGGIVVIGASASATLTDTVITGNLADRGGGVSLAYLGGYGTFTMTRGAVTSNVASSIGGGILAGGTVTANSVNFGGTNSPNDTEYGSDSDTWGTSASFTCTPGGGCN